MTPPASELEGQQRLPMSAEPWSRRPRAANDRCVGRSQQDSEAQRPGSDARQSRRPSLAARLGELHPGQQLHPRCDLASLGSVRPDSSSSLYETSPFAAVLQMKAPHQVGIHLLLCLHSRVVVSDKSNKAFVCFGWLVTGFDVSTRNTANSFNIPPLLLKVPEQAIRKRKADQIGIRVCRYERRRGRNRRPLELIAISGGRRVRWGTGSPCTTCQPTRRKQLRQRPRTESCLQHRHSLSRDISGCPKGLHDHLRRSKH